MSRPHSATTGARTIDSKLHRLEENIGAAGVELSADELAEIEDVASKIQVQGGRYNEAAESMTNL